MLINFMWHRVATNPKPDETDGLLDFNVDFLNKIPIQWFVLGGVLIARRDRLRRSGRSRIPSPAAVDTGGRRAEQRLSVAPAAPPRRYGRSRPCSASPRARRWRSPAGSPTATTACAGAAATACSGCPGKDTELLGIDRRAEWAATRRRRRPASARPRSRSMPGLGCSVTEFVDARPVEPEELRAADPGGGRRRCARSTRRPALPVRFDVVRRGAAVPSRDRARARRRAAAGLDGARGRRERGSGRGAHGPRARAGPVPQRPADRELARRRRAAVDRRLGVRRHGRPLLRPRQPRGQQRLRRGRRRARCSTPTGRTAARRRGSPPCG